VYKRQEFDRAINILGIFEGVGLVVSVIGILGTVLAVGAGALGFRGLDKARSEVEETRKEIRRELDKARAEIEDDIRQGRDALEGVQREVAQSVRDQRERAEKATLALSFQTLGERQYRAKDFSGAAETYKRALELDPNNLMTHYRLGYVYTQSGSLEEAQHSLLRALDIQPDFAPAVAALGYVYRRLGDRLPLGRERDKTYNEAERLLLKALEMSPNLVDEDGESWSGSLGGLYRRRGQIEQAIAAYEDAARVTPQSSYAFSNLALLYLNQGSRDKMIRTYQRVEILAAHERQAELENYWAYADLLTSRLALGKVREAEETLVTVLDGAPRESSHYFSTLLDTLYRLVGALGEENASHVKHAIAVIEGHIAAQTRSEETSEA
jgi:tetratricopeptide (TPR) repeat protein